MTGWRKSSFSGNDNCVEVPKTLDAVRDSKNPDVVMPTSGLRICVDLMKAGRSFTPVAS